MEKNEIKFFQKAGLKKGFVFFFFNSKGSSKFRQMLINVYFTVKRENFMKKNFYFLNTFSSSEEHKIFQKIGYYLIKLGTKKVLIHFEYIEKLEKKKRILKNSVKKKSQFIGKAIF